MASPGSVCKHSYDYLLVREPWLRLSIDRKNPIRHISEMKLLLPCFTLACAVSLLHAEELTDSDRADAIKWLEEYKDAYTSGANKRIATAKSALKRASSDEMAALELYKAAIKQTQFESRPSLDYIEWEKSQKDTFTNLGFKTGLKIQCHWMLLYLIMAEAEKNKVDIAFPIGEVSSIFNEIASNPQVIEAQNLISGGPAGAIKTFLKVNDLNSKSFTINPFDIGGFFDKTLLPAIEKTGKIADYRKTWLWRIDLERKIHIDPETLAEKEDDSNRDRNKGNRGGDRGEKKKSSSGIANARAGTLIAGTGNELNNKARLARQAKASQRLSELRWEMEKACFSMGDEKVALKALKEMVLDPNLDPEKVLSRLTVLTSLLTIANETTPAVQSAGATKKVKDDGIDWSTTEDVVPAPKAPAAGKKKAAVSADSPVQDTTPTPPAEPAKEAPAKDNSAGDDWNL